MEKFFIEGPSRLEGEVVISGAKMRRWQLFLRFYWQKSLVFWRISQTSTM